MDYRKAEGEWYEKELAKYLMAIGWRDVNTTPSSGDYGADILAIAPDGKRVAIQCKYFSQGHKVGSSAVQEVFTAKSYYGCDEAMIITSTELTNQANDMTKRLGVQVWEGWYPPVASGRQEVVYRPMPNQSTAGEDFAGCFVLMIIGIIGAVLWKFISLFFE